jgi:hypothetical protein
MENFLHFCRNPELITEWLCIDDNSSDEDRAMMQEKYPQFRFIWKGPEDRGHARSMNLLVTQISTPYVLHWEDGWTLDRPLDLQALLNFIQSKPEILQIRLLNDSDAHHYQHLTTDFVPVHPYNPLYLTRPVQDIRVDYQFRELQRRGNHDLAAKLQRHEWNHEGCYWPGFGLSPSINRLAALREIGPFDECRDFEFIYGLKIYYSTYQVWMYHHRIYHIGDDISAYHLQKEIRSWDNPEVAMTKLLNKLYQVPTSQVAYYVKLCRELYPDTPPPEVEFLMELRQYEAQTEILTTLSTSTRQLRQLIPTGTGLDQLDQLISMFQAIPNLMTLEKLATKSPRREILRHLLDSKLGMSDFPITDDFKSDNPTKPVKSTVTANEIILDTETQQILRRYLPYFNHDIGTYRPDPRLYGFSYRVNLWFRLGQAGYPELGALLLPGFDWTSLNESLLAYRDAKNDEMIASIFEFLQDQIDFHRIDPPDLRYRLLSEFLTSLINLQEYDLASEIIPLFRHTHIDDAIISLSDRLAPHLKTMTKIVATYDPNRQPHDNELIICYGNYPNIYDNLLGGSNPCYRHLKYFWNLSHDVVEADPIWDPIDRIFVINLDSAIDRWVDTLSQCRKMGIPLTKVERFPALTTTLSTDPRTRAYIGCSMSHCRVLDLALERNYQHTLVLEDDFTFNDSIERTKECLRQFFSRKYDYDICLLATSKYYTIKPHDDLVSQSFQYCTTASGYIYSRPGALKLKPVWQEGLMKLQQTNDYNYTCDVCWSSLQKDGKFFTFNWKIGYQKPAYSSAMQQVTANLD